MEDLSSKKYRAKNRESNKITYLSKDKMTGQCKGFAFVHYYKKDDATKAIATLNGFGYDHLILNVEWAKPSGS